MPEEERQRLPAALNDDAFWDLRGRIGQWITAYTYEHEYERVILYLSRILAEVRFGQDCHVLARLQALEMGQPTDPEESPDDE